MVVHYVTTGLDAPPLNDDNANGVPDYVEEAGAAADTAFAYYAARGFRAPLADGAGPNTLPDIYIKHFHNPDLFGLTYAPFRAQGGSFVIISSHLDQSPGLARGSLAGTVAHELFHVVQYAYVPRGQMPAWVAEGSAEAMSLLVEPKIEDLVSIDYMDQWLAQPWRPLFDERFYCDHCYGGALWWATLAQGEPTLLPQYFAALGRQAKAKKKPGFGLDLLSTLLRKHGAGSLDSVFFRFAVGLYRAGLRPVPTYTLTARRSATIHVERIDPLSMHFIPIAVPRILPEPPARDRELLEALPRGRDRGRPEGARRDARPDPARHCSRTEARPPDRHERRGRPAVVRDQAPGALRRLRQPQTSCAVSTIRRSFATWSS